MGINKLNAFLNQYASNSIKKKSLFQLKNKSVAVDYSIFYYKFKKSRGEQTLKGAFIRQIKTFQFYNITPIYIFDGKPDANKLETIQNRNREIVKYKEKMEEERKKIVRNRNLIKKYERKTVKLNIIDINICKQLFRNQNIQFIQANGEADELCCSLYKENKVSGIFTEDNDLLLGGSIIYKGLNNYNDSIYEYNLKSILEELDISYNIFLKICLLAGSTYTKKVCSIFILYENYKKYDKINHSKYQDKEILYNKYVKSEIVNEPLNLIECC